MSYKLNEYTKKEQIIIWICTILVIILSFIGMATIYACFTKKIEIIKAQSTALQISIPQQISIDDWNNKKNNEIKVGNFSTNNYLCSVTKDNRQIRIYYINIYNNSIIFGMKIVTIENGFISEGGLFYIQYTYNDNYEYQSSNINSSLAYTIPTEEEILSTEWEISEIGQTYINNNQNKMEIWSNVINYAKQKLQTPTITLNLNTIQWNYIENADYYNVFRNGNLVGQTYYNQWVTIENGIYTIQACTNNNEEYSNSELSNSITQNNYNDLIGNGVNWFTFFSAYIDSQIHLIKSLTNYTIWDINFFQLFSFIITIILAVIIIKFVKGF